MDYLEKIKVTVLLPVYNGEKFLKSAIESILNQTFENFQLLIINDGSTDNSEKIIKGFNDKRIKYIVNKRNIGLINTLNKGLQLIQSEYIARMDADDISLQTRLEKQIRYMDQHRDIMVSGTSIQLFDSNNIKRKHIVSNDPLKIKTQLLFNCALMHPTVIMRREFIIENNFTYNEEHQSVEDFGLWQKISFSNKLGNIQEVLLRYRVNESGITQVAEKDVCNRDLMHMKIYKQAFDYFGIAVSIEQLKQYRLFVTGRAFSDENDILEISKLLELLKQSVKMNGYDLETFYSLISSYFRASCINKGLSYQESIHFYKKYFLDVFKFNIKEKIKFLIRRYLL